MPFQRLSLANVWAEIAGSDDIANEGAARKVKVSRDGKILWYVTGTDYSFFAPGVLRRSLDFGYTWADVALPAGCDACLDLVQDGHSLFWGLFWDTAGSTAKVASATALGSWTIRYTSSAFLYAFNIAASPDGQKIAYTQQDGSNFNLVISVNGGGAWTVKLIGGTDFFTWFDIPLVQILASGDIVVYLSADAIFGADVVGSGGSLSPVCELVP